MHDYSQNVSLHCPRCGNDQFSSNSDHQGDPFDAPDDIVYQCSDCKSFYSKAEMLKENQSLIDSHVEVMQEEIARDIVDDFRKACRKWKNKFKVTTKWKDKSGKPSEKSQWTSL